jgi:hypothetical protein
MIVPLVWRKNGAERARGSSHTPPSPHAQPYEMGACTTYGYMREEHQCTLCPGNVYQCDGGTKKGTDGQESPKNGRSSFGNQDETNRFLIAVFAPSSQARWSCRRAVVDLG